MTDPESWPMTWTVEVAADELNELELLWLSLVDNPRVTRARRLIGRLLIEMRESRGGVQSMAEQSAPPWLQQDRVWAYCLCIIGTTMWGVNRHQRRLEEFYRLHPSARPNAGPDRH